jgi:hypothetical protein
MALLKNGQAMRAYQNGHRLNAFRNGEKLWGVGPKGFQFVLDITQGRVGRTQSCSFPEGAENLEIDWGDGSVTNFSGGPDSSVSHAYSAVGQYTVAMDAESFPPFARLFGSALASVITPIPEIATESEDILEAFAGCSQLSDVPANLFKNNMDKNFKSAFAECEGLTAVPESFQWPGTSIEGMFENSGFAALWAGMFNGSAVTDFTRAFRGCWDIVATSDSPMPRIFGATISTGIGLGASPPLVLSEMFDGCSGITAVPQALIQYRNVLNTRYMFARCNIATVPGSFYSNVKQTEYIGTWAFNPITSVNSAFYSSFTAAAQNTSILTVGEEFEGCTGITSLSGPFYNIKKAKGFYNTFKGCTGLKSVTYALSYTSGCESIEGVFDGCAAITATAANLLYGLTGSGFSDLRNFRRALRGCAKITGTTPKGPNGAEFWDIDGAEGEGCYEGCTTLSNYTSIPAGWK